MAQSTQSNGGVRRRRLRRRRRRNLEAHAAKVTQPGERPEKVAASPGPVVPRASTPPPPPARFQGLSDYVNGLDRDGVREQLTDRKIDYDGRLSTDKLKTLLLAAAVKAATDGNSG